MAKKKQTSSSPTTKKTRSTSQSKGSDSAAADPAMYDTLEFGDFLIQKTNGTLFQVVDDLPGAPFGPAVRVQRVGAHADRRDRFTINRDQLPKLFDIFVPLAFADWAAQMPKRFGMKAPPRKAFVSPGLQVIEIPDKKGDTPRTGAIEKVSSMVAIIAMDDGRKGVMQVPFSSLRFWVATGQPGPGEQISEGKVKRTAKQASPKPIVEKKKTTVAKLKIEAIDRIRGEVRKLDREDADLMEKLKRVRAVRKLHLNAMNEVIDEGTLPLWDPETGQVIEYVDDDEDGDCPV